MAEIAVAVIGARRVRQGTGPYLARHAAAAGARVVAVLGTTAASAAAAGEELARDGLEVEAFHELPLLLTKTAPTALIIASPTGHHARWLAAALEAGCHVLCEKPLLVPGKERVAAGQAAVLAQDLMAAFAARGLHLEEICQWPWVLSAAHDLHPTLRLKEVQAFRMHLEPPLRGALRWQEMLSHPLSLLQAMAPGPAELAAVCFHQESPQASEVGLSFRYRVGARELRCEIELHDRGEFPRRAEFQLDDFLCRREVHAPDYRMTLTDGKRVVPSPDPMAAQVQAFLATLARVQAGGALPTKETLGQRMSLLAELLALAPGEGEAAP